MRERDNGAGAVMAVIGEMAQPSLWPGSSGWPARNSWAVQAPAAFALQDQNPQRVAATADHNAGLVGLQDLAGRAGALDDFRLPDLEQVRLGLAGQMS